MVACVTSSVWVSVVGLCPSRSAGHWDGGSLLFLVSAILVVVINSG